MSSTLAAPTPANADVRPAGLPVAVLGLGADLPDQVVTNDDLAERLATNDAWIRTRTGIAQRHVAQPAISTGDLAVEAEQRGEVHGAQAPVRRRRGILARV
ncbi:MAG: hypothetical protein KY442_05565, partial [Proteobacteria bacterium]|nr:hypothetical protein [Pseudomonadota bacterium]